MAGLTAGGDDYVTKPFSLEEVVARLRGLLRRAGARAAREESVLTVGDLTLDEDSHEVRRGGEEITLTATEFELLRFLMRNPRRVLSQGADPRPGLELRLRRPGQRRRALHLLPAQEDRRRPRADDPHHARRGLRAEAMKLPRLPHLAAGAHRGLAGGAGLAAGRHHHDAGDAQLPHRPARQRGRRRPRPRLARRRRPGRGAAEPAAHRPGRRRRRVPRHPRPGGRHPDGGAQLLRRPRRGDHLRRREAARHRGARRARRRTRRRRGPHRRPPRRRHTTASPRCAPTTASWSPGSRPTTSTA